MYVVWRLSCYPTSFPGKALEKIAASGARLSPYLIAVSLTVFGIENLIHDKLVFIVGAPAYEVPGEAFWVYFTSIIFIGAAFSIFFSKRVATITALLGVYIFFIAIIFYGPLLWANIYDGHAWATFAERNCDDWQRIYLIKGIIERKNHSVAGKYSGLNKRWLFAAFLAQSTLRTWR